MEHRYPTLLIIIMLWTLSGCTPEIDTPAPSGASLKLDRMVVVGSCMAAGMANSEVRQGPGLPPTEVPFGGFYFESQQYAFPNILAGNLQDAGAPPFLQPRIEGAGSGHLELSTVVPAYCENGPLQYVLDWSAGLSNWNQTTPGEGIHNRAIPHLMLRDVFDQQSNYGNPYQHWMMGTSADSSCYCTYVTRSRPTFSLISLGMEDVLYYAYNGGGVNNPYPMTKVSLFASHYKALVQNLLAEEGSKVVLLNIPDVTRMAFFTGIPVTRYDRSTCAESPVYIERLHGESGPAGLGDRILLSAEHALRTGGGTPSNPLPEKLVLDSGEVAEVQSRIHTFNAVMADLAREFNSRGKRVTVVDLYTLYEKVHEGVYETGAELSGDYISGGFYSLDGIMPTPRGNALIANAITKALQEAYPELNLPTASLLDYPTIKVP